MEEFLLKPAVGYADLTSIPCYRERSLLYGQTVEHWCKLVKTHTENPITYSTSASPNIMVGLFPPSSRVTAFRLESAAAFMTAKLKNSVYCIN